MMAQCGQDRRLSPPAGLSFDVAALSTQRLEDSALVLFVQSFTALAGDELARLQASVAALTGERSALREEKEQMAADHEQKVSHA